MTSRAHTTRFSRVVSLFLGVLPAVAHAQFTRPQNPGLPVTDLPTGLANIITTVLLLVGVIALGFIVWGGFKYIIAKGDEPEIEAAKLTITGGIIGIIVIGLALAIVRFVFQAVGST